VAIVLLASRTGGQELTKQLGLDEAVQLALDRNLDIKVERLTPQLFDYSLASTP
jgi:hypothetical protein